MLLGLINTIIVAAFLETEVAGWQQYVPLSTLAKVFNLLLFVGALYFLLRRPIGEAFRARREGIRLELMRAQEERNAALAKLEEVEGRLSLLDAEVEAIRVQAQKEAAEERARIERSTEADIRKLREQAQREIESASKAARAELRAYTAEQSIRLAEEMIRKEIRPEDDKRLMNEYVEELGGIKR
jgi:F0F1-type ATP synthase membrane subunit b/b'